MKVRRSSSAIIFSMALLVASSVIAQTEFVNGCQITLFSPGQYGPWDYRTRPDMVPIVLGAHFRPQTEMLVRGVTMVKPGPDIDYTLRAVPGFPRALIAMMNLGEKERTDKPEGSSYTIDCWFQRALRFRPDDNVARMIYVTYLTKQKRNEEALRQAAIVRGTAQQDNPFTQYNLGLLYFDLGAYDESLMHAHKAAAMGFPATELQSKLKNAGKWKDPAPEETGSTQPSGNSEAAHPAPAQPVKQ